MTTERVSAEQLAIAMMAEARKLQLDTGLGRMAMAERLAQWASDVRQLGVELAKARGSFDMEHRRANEAERRLGLAREEVTKLEMVRSDHPDIAAGPLLTVLSYFVDGIVEALDD